MLKLGAIPLRQALKIRMISTKKLKKAKTKPRMEENLDLLLKIVIQHTGQLPEIRELKSELIGFKDTQPLLQNPNVGLEVMIKSYLLPTLDAHLRFVSQMKKKLKNLKKQQPVYSVKDPLQASTQDPSS
jgi:hypothetical protein